MIFSDRIYPKPVVSMILDGTKCQTRRTVKEGEEMWTNPKNNIDVVTTLSKDITKHPLRTKWQVGRDYAVQLGRGKPCVHHPHPCNGFLIPLRIKITGIHRERLLDISEEDAKKEGFKDKQTFIEAFMKVNSLADALKVFKNPELWVLDFKVKQ